jgi:D-cysteine desulfhydrase
MAHDKRLQLVHAPTPVEQRPALDERLGVALWIKRDDASGGAEAGNKIRKLEWLLGDAVERRANVVLTCGGLQSNHARATAIVCARLGLRCVLFLRVPDELAGDPMVPSPRDKLLRTGNVLLDRLVGAEIRLISRADYAQRAAVMERAAQELSRTPGETGSRDRPYLIPEGGSNGLGSLGYVEAMRELRGQMDAGLAGGSAELDEIVVACGSGGTAAGLALGAARFGVAKRVRAVAVCDSAAYFERVIDRIVQEARAIDGSLGPPAPLVVDESSRGPAYGVMTAKQRAFVVDVARTSGLLLDPVYTGKALFGVAQAVERGDIARGARILFLHTGGLPGLLAQGDDFAAELA